MTDVADITLVRGAIHNPDEPRHFMRVVPADSVRTAAVGHRSIARSADALVVKEVAADVYDPVIYFPRRDVAVELLEPTDKTTHCPVKGDTEYFDLVIDGTRIADAAWSYVNPIEAAHELQDLIAFDTSRVTLD